MLCALGIGSLLSRPASAMPPLARSASGVYVGGARSSDFARFSSWLGMRPAHVLSFLDDTSWRSIENPRWVIRLSAHSHARLVLSVPMLPAYGDTLAQGATGVYDEHFRRLAKVLRAGGKSHAILRLGWEMNGDWFPWSIHYGNAANYVAYFRQIVTTMRGVSRHFQFDWCVGNGSSWASSSVLNAARGYPGNAYVDYIGMDIYDQSWVANAGSEVSRWHGYVTARYGLRWQRAFARAHHKPITFPEWGLMAGGHGGGDSTAFVKDMYGWMARGHPAYQMYFDFSNSVLSDFPASAAVYRQLFGAVGASIHG
jgi:hypothetical protein